MSTSTWVKGGSNPNLETYFGTSGNRTIAKTESETVQHSSGRTRGRGDRQSGWDETVPIKEHKGERHAKHSTAKRTASVHHRSIGFRVIIVYELRARRIPLISCKAVNESHTHG
uniref:Uncharacterized protein n=1 Tax=Ascaris lumbricoides TaxID=6252 RepID=A0A0M3HN74_ASCLU